MDCGVPDMLVSFISSLSISCLFVHLFTYLFYFFIICTYTFICVCAYIYICIHKEYPFRPSQNGNFTTAVIEILSDGNVTRVLSMWVVFSGVLKIRLIHDIFLKERKKQKTKHFINQIELSKLSSNYSFLWCLFS